MTTYEINVARRATQFGRSFHFCLIQLGECGSDEEAKILFDDIAARFPASDGFHLELYSAPIKIHTMLAKREA